MDPEEGGNPTTLDARVSAAIKEEIRAFTSSEDFKSRVDKAMKPILDEAASQAWKRSSIAAALVFFIFFVAAAYQYMQIRERRAEVNIEYSEAVSLVQEIRDTLRSLRDEVEATSQAISLEVSHLAATLAPVEATAAAIATDSSAAATQLPMLLAALTPQPADTQEIFLDPRCSRTHHVKPGTAILLEFAPWAAATAPLVDDNANNMMVEAWLDGSPITGVRQPPVKTEAIPCPDPRRDGFWVLYQTLLPPLDPGSHTFEVTQRLTAWITDEFDLDEDGKRDWYGPEGEEFTDTFTIVVSE